MKTELLNLTLLYVEDDFKTRVSLSEVFQHKFQQVYVAKDGIEALELFKKHKINFIISDFQMPNMDGNELCREIKNINSSIPFVLLTAYSDSNLLINAIDAGVDKFLQKPVDAKKMFIVIDNIYELLMIKFKLEKSTACLEEAEKIALLSYWDVNLKNNVINFSQEAKELFNLSDETDVNYKMFSSIVQEEDKTRFLKIFEERIYTQELIDEIIVIKNSRNKSIYIHVLAKRWKSSACGTNHIIGLFQDVSHYEIQRVELLKEAQSDPMLKIANKRLLVLELQKLINLAKRYGHQIGIIFFDIDDFKYINDKYGHLIADEILVELSTLIKYDIRQSDLFGRWGGDEFVIITGYSSQDATIEFAKKILEKVKSHSWVKNINLTISIGIAFYKADDDVNSLLNRADFKMLEAKKTGKNKYYY